MRDFLEKLIQVFCRHLTLDHPARVLYVNRTRTDVPAIYAARCIKCGKRVRGTKGQLKATRWRANTGGRA